ncbi:M23 family metallopeptidase [Sphingobium sp. HT1-2]|uniref:M23 family metallopeptidase n=1 Tax=Sphingobium sp. HT1-2 TaxID=3111640 RepID=UPI003C1272FB
MGKSALEHRPAAGKAIDDAFASTLAQADRRTRRYLEPQLARLRMSADNEMSSYALQQSRVYQQETGKAKLGNFIESAIAADDPAQRDGFFAQIRAQSRANAELAGLADPEVIKAEERSAVSGAHAAIFDRYMAGEDVEMAKAYLEAHEGDMLSKDSTSRWADLKAPLQAREAASDANAFMGIASVDGGDRAVNYADPLRGMGRGISGQYGEARGGGHTHNGVDFPAPAGTPIFATAAGKVIKSGHDSASGNFVIIDHGDGTTSSYSHMQAASPLKPGDMVTPDTKLGGVGSTGRSTGPHLHMVVRQNGKTVDPTKVIGSAQQSATRYDLDGLLAKVDARDDWTFERRERAKDEIRRRVSLSDSLKARQESDASDAALEWMLKKGDSFTDLSQMPSAIRNNLSPEARTTFTARAKSNLTGDGVKGNSIDAMRLHVIQHGNPDAFLKLNLAEYVGKVTNAELDSAVADQARLRGPGGDKIIQTRSAISTAIGNYIDRDPAMSSLLDKKTNPASYARVAQGMERFITEITKGKRDPTGQEMDAAWRQAIMPVVKPASGWFGSDEKVPRFQAGERYQVAVPIVVRERIIREWRAAHSGQMPPDGVIGDLYIQGKGKLWE